MADIIGKVQGDEHKNTILMGGFYRRPVEGDVVMTWGFGPGYVVYASEDGPGARATRDEMDTWDFLEGARDFPNAKDPRLPYEFDLYYDVHRLSQLIHDFGGLESALRADHIKALCKSYGIDLRDPQTIRDYNAKFLTR